MKAIILAAGRGSRMGNLTDDKPKCLVSVGGNTLLERQVSALTQGGVTEIAIVTGYLHEVLERQPHRIFHNPRWKETNMLASLTCAAEWLSRYACVVSYSDIFYESAAVRSLAECTSPLAITYDKNWLELWKHRFADPLSDAETFAVNERGMLTEIGGKPLSTAQVSGQYMGLLRITPHAWREIEGLRVGVDASTWDRMDMTGMLRQLLAAGKTPIEAVPYSGTWGEVDSESDLDLYNNSYAGV